MSSRVEAKPFIDLGGVIDGLAAECGLVRDMDRYGRFLMEVMNQVKGAEGTKKHILTFLYGGQASTVRKSTPVVAVGGHFLAVRKYGINPIDRNSVEFYGSQIELNMFDQADDNRFDTPTAVLAGYDSGVLTTPLGPVRDRRTFSGIVVVTNEIFYNSSMPTFEIPGHPVVVAEPAN